MGLRPPLRPFDARMGVNGVFHPAYVALHLATAERLGREWLVVARDGSRAIRGVGGRRLSVQLGERLGGVKLNPGQRAHKDEGA